MPPKYHVLKIENIDFKQILRNLSLQKTKFNLTCYFPEIDTNYFEKPRDPYAYPYTKTSLFGIIFLSICIILVFVVCMGWFAITYCRQLKQYRLKKRLRQAIETSTQEVLNKSPVIIYEMNTLEIDDDPMCAICLESFKTKEKLRKLGKLCKLILIICLPFLLTVCSHYFHIACVDPWLLSRQSCPLCNRNILRNSIPSISSSIMDAINERRNDETTSIANDYAERTLQL
jgi:hypothetical protein